MNLSKRNRRAVADTPNHYKLTEDYHCQRGNQSTTAARERTRLRHERIVAFFRWKHQAEGMLSRFWQTGDVRALAAFVVHILAMRRRLNNEIEGRSQS